MAQGHKKLIVQRFRDQEAVPIAIAPGAIVRDVLDEIGEQGAMALATGPRHGLVFLPHATLWNWVADEMTLYIVRSSCPC
jgi:hypothetical protein